MTDLATRPDQTIDLTDRARPTDDEFVPLADSPQSEIVTITPAMADFWLGRNLNNRNLRLMHVDRLAADMAAGKWKVNGESIAFDWDANLLNGQHRLHACIKAGVSFTTFVNYGLDPESNIATDTGARRTLSDRLKYQGEANSTSLAAAINLCQRLDTAGNLTGARRTPTISEAIAWLNDNPGIRAAVTEAGRVRDLGIPVSVLSALSYFTRKIEPDESAAFMNMLATGANLAEDHPVYALRRWAIKAKDSNSRKPDSPMYTAVAIKSWNAFIEGRRVRNLSWRRGGATPEPYPTFSHG